VEVLRNRGANAALATAAGIWALGWVINFVALDDSSPRGHSIVLLGAPPRPLQLGSARLR
jgi:hypothetical protein